MSIEILTQWPKNRAVAHLIIAHGAGAPMDSGFMDAITGELTTRNIAVSRFEFAYMAGRRRPNGTKRPPPRVDKLTTEYINAIEHIRQTQPTDAALLIGGKSMGGRVASMIADAQFNLGHVSGLVCLGYPFHPANKPDNLRTEHLALLECPTLIVQGNRDKLGNYDEVSGYELSPQISVTWLTDGDHDFKPRKASGTTHDLNIAAAAKAITTFIAQQRQ